jgi:hypothetical protein
MERSRLGAVTTAELIQSVEHVCLEREDNLIIPKISVLSSLRLEKRRRCLAWAGQLITSS